MANEEEVKINLRRDAFASIAIWQIAAFIFLLCLVWFNELLDIPAMMFGAEPTPFSLYRACLLSAAVITAGVVVIGHTYEKQRSLLKKLLETCMYCHRVKQPNGEWEHVEVYFIRHYPIAMSRGACPECREMLQHAHKKDGSDGPVESLLELVEE